MTSRRHARLSVGLKRVLLVITLEGIGVVRLGEGLVSVCGGDEYADVCGR